MVSKRWLKGKWQVVEIAGAASTAPTCQIPSSGIRMRCLAWKITGPRQRRLLGQQTQEHSRAIGVSGVLRQFQTCAPRAPHQLLDAAYLKRRSPPPCRGRRSLVFGNRAPLDELIHGAFEWHIRSLMHRNPPDPWMISAAGTEAMGADRLLLAVLPV